MVEPAKFFDWYSSWHLVERVLKRSRVQKALDTLMTHLCDAKGLEWDRKKGPAFYGDPLPPEYRTKAKVNFYRCWKNCHTINVWAGVLGEEIFPRLQWVIATKKDLYHATAIGLKNGSPNLIMDLVWGSSHKLNEEQRIWGAQQVLNAVCDSNGRIESVSVSDRLSHFSRRECA